MKWKVRKGSKVSQGALLGFYKLLNIDEKTTSKEENSAATEGDIVCQQKLKSSHVGTVLEVVAEEGQELDEGSVVVQIEACTHPTVMKDMCADCGADLRNDMGVSGDRKETVSATVAMVHSIPELIVSEEQALELGRADEVRLKNTKKLVLLVDLDQTLIHTTNDNIPTNLKGVHHFQLRHGMNLLWYHTRIRPHTLQFLENISKLYELHICTFGVRMYAHTIVRFIDPGGKFFSHRILSRDECFNAMSKTANLKALFPCGDSMVCIIDDREDVWNYAPNLIHVKPYRFFQGTADINAPPGLSKKENDSKPIIHRVRRVSSSPIDDEKDLGVDDEEEEKLKSEKYLGKKTSSGLSTVKDNKQSSDKEEGPSEGGPGSVGNKEDSSSSGGEKTKTEIRQSSRTYKSAKIKKDNDSIKAGSKTASNSKDLELPSDDGSVSGISADDSMSGISAVDNDASVANTVKAKKTEETDEEDEEEEEMEVENESEDDMEEIEWEDEDDYLFYLEEILKRIHKAYFDISKQVPAEGASTKAPDTKLDLKAIIPYVRRKVLRGCALCFSGVVPLNTPVEKSRAYTVAKSLGANVHTSFVPYCSSRKGIYTTHLIANKMGTSKVNAAKRSKKVQIVTSEWLWACCERWEKVDERLFPLTEKVSLDASIKRTSPDVVVREPKSKSLKRKFKNVDDESSGKKKQNREDNSDSSDDDNDDIFDELSGGTIGESTEKDKEALKKSGSRYNPLYSFSDEERASMDKELEELMDEDDSDSDENESEAKLRKEVLLDRKCDTSSEDSLSGEFPHGWKSKKWCKRRSQKKKVIIKRDENETDESEASVAETYEKLIETHVAIESSSSSNGDSECDSIGSVDEEIARAVEQKFLER